MVEERTDYSPDSLARKLGITRRTLDRYMKDGRGPGYLRIGRRIVIRHQVAEEWLKSLEVPRVELNEIAQKRVAYSGSFESDRVALDTLACVTPRGEGALNRGPAGRR